MRTFPRVAATVLSGSLALTLAGVPLGLPAPVGADPVAQDDRFIRRAFFDLLNEADPTQADVDEATAMLSDMGTGQWLAELQRTDEGRGAVVEDLFDTILRRDPSPADRTFFIARLARFNRQKVAADLYASAEYYAERGGGTDAGWIDALYLDALGRPADEGGKQYFVDELASGRRKRGGIASFFTNGTEGRNVLVKRLYVELLDREAEPGGQAFYADLIRRGSSVERVVGIFTASSEYRGKARADLGDEAIIILTSANELVFSTTGDAEVEDRTIPVVGLAEGASLLGIDIRPSNGVLYGVTNTGQVVTINPGSGNATPLGAPIAGFAPSGGVGFDFNPMADALRIVTGTQNYRINPNTGAPGANTPDGPLAYAAGDRNAGTTPDASAAAYTMSTRGLPLPGATALYDIDEATNSVVQQVPANAGTLVTKGKLHLDATAVNGFDVSPDGPQSAYAVLDAPNAGPSVWRIDLGNGEPRLVSTGAPDNAIGLAVIGDEVVTPDETAYGATGGVTPALVTFNPDGDPASTTKLFTGLDIATEVVGLDVRPKTNVLHAIGSNGQIYTVDPSGATAVATKLGTPIAQFVAADGVGFDFNPAADALRITNGSRNYRVSPATGLVVGEGTMGSGTPGSLQYVAGDDNAGSTPDASGAAYTNSQRSETQPAATALFDIDEGTDALVRQNPANAGDLLTIGELGVDPTAVAGFDVSGGLGQTAYAVLTVGGAQGLYRIDLGTGEAALLGPVTGGLTAFAVV